MKEQNQDQLGGQAQTDTNRRFLLFELGEETYAMPLLDVREVIGVPETTPVPSSPSYFNGITNLRGQVISIFDLRKKLNIKPKEDTRENAVIIIQLSHLNIGIVVDRVVSVQSLSDSDISPAPEVSENNKNKYLYGVARKEDKLILLIDLKKVLDVSDLSHAKEKVS